MSWPKRRSKRASSNQAACKDISVVISTASSTLSRQPGDSIESVDLEGQLTLANAAKASGVKRFVYVSFRNDPTVRYPLNEAKRAASVPSLVDLDFTSNPGQLVYEVWLSPALGFDFVLSKARLYGSGSRPISWVSYRDVAEFCIAPALRGVAMRSVLAVGGPRLEPC